MANAVNQSRSHDRLETGEMPGPGQDPRQHADGQHGQGFQGPPQARGRPDHSADDIGTGNEPRVVGGVGYARVWIIPLEKIRDILWVYSSLLPGGWKVTSSPTWSGPSAPCRRSENRRRPKGTSRASPSRITAARQAPSEGGGNGNGDDDEGDKSQPAYVPSLARWARWRRCAAADQRDGAESGRAHSCTDA